MKTAEIRRRWLKFFASKDHEIVPSASLISEDPTLMFTVAGMVPFIPYMTGLVPAPYKRATSVQKCVRTLDIEEVGKTTRHGTFFQMNGNFSFGDYFKNDAISYAWEFLTSSTEAGGLGIDPERLWVTVYQDDDESIKIWQEVAKIPMARIQKRGMKDNYWSTGQPGPAGPCSEIYFDRGPEYGVEGGPEADEDRYIEIWNLVFMQFERGAGTGKDSFEILGELPSKNIDTGMGLERVAFLLQEVDNLYEIDEVRPVLDLAAKLSGKNYGDDENDDIRLRVVADHVRSALMLIGDGVTPANDGRGYVLRRLLRRVVRAMRLLGVEAPVFKKLFTASKDAMKESYPELETDFERISRTAVNEEEAFLRTLNSGLLVLDEEITKAKGSKAKSLTGDSVFLLHDTYGFPVDLTFEIAQEAGLDIDRDKFTSLMNIQRQRAKDDAKQKRSTNADLSVYGEFRSLGTTKFTGYQELISSAKVVGLIRDGEVVESLVTGESAEVILDETSFYAESGGQDSDSGLIVANGVVLEVLDVQKPVKGLVSHSVVVKQGAVGIGDKVTTEVSPDWRLGAAQAHSATHVVHAALRQVLGPQALQSGSYNKPGYMRLDFSWSEALAQATKTEIEEVTNLAIRADLAVSAQFMTVQEAKDFGAVALFGETYDESVRVVQIGGPWSRELCGGTHVSRSSQVGLVSLIGESSVGSGSRRLEAYVGFEAFQFLAAERALVSVLTESLKVPREQLIEKVTATIDELRSAQKKLASLAMNELKARIPQFVETAKLVGSTKLVAESIGEVDSAEQVRELTVALREKLEPAAAVVAVAGSSAGKVIFLVATTKAARDSGIGAGKLVKEASEILGGGGGGKDDIAQGGGPEVASLDKAFAAVERSISG
ncbi:MAG: alanine--tRNA ligase [Rhodoluna sp.]